MSHVVHYGCEEYAVCGTRTLKSGDTLLWNGIENGMTVRVLRRAPWWSRRKCKCGHPGTVAVQCLSCD